MLIEVDGNSSCLSPHAANRASVLHEMQRWEVALPRHAHQYEKLLSACLLGKTQNINEHLHSRIWRYCSKYKSANKNIVEYAVGQAILDYNVGYEDGFVLPEFAPPYTKIQQEAVRRRDRQREVTRDARKRRLEAATNGSYGAGEF